MHTAGIHIECTCKEYRSIFILSFGAVETIWCSEFEEQFGSILNSNSVT